MNKSDLWQLFKSTGKIEYYLKYKNIDNKNIKKTDKEKND